MAFTGISFIEFKRRFYEKAGDLCIFDCMEFNLLKVVLDGLKVDYVSTGKAGTRFLYPDFLYELVLALKRRKSGKKITAEMRAGLDVLKNRPYLVIDHAARWAEDENGKPVSLYFSKLVELLGAGKVAHLVERRPQRKYPYDLLTAGWAEITANSPIDADDRELRKALIQSYRRIAGHGKFEKKDLLNIAIAFEKFFHEYRLWKQLLAQLPQQEIFLLCHYHREGSILAMRRKGRKITELQHGLIAPEDIFYCFPEPVKQVREKALFPDRILVFGKFWKERLEKGYEFLPGQVEIGGYFMYDNDAVPETVRRAFEDWRKTSKVILITTQTNMHNQFVEYATWLAQDIRSRNLDIVIVVRPHPAEPDEVYAGLEKQPALRVMRDSLGYLIKNCDWHLTVCSTTIFDALRYGKPSFSIDLEEFDDYIRSMEEAGVTRRIGKKVNPVDMPALKINPEDISRYYAAFDPGLLLKQSMQTGLE